MWQKRTVASQALETWRMMMKIVIITSLTAILLGTSSAPSAASDSLSYWNNSQPVANARGRNPNRPQVRVRSDKVSNGIGDDSRGSATGGPAGGLIDKN